MRNYVVLPIIAAAAGIGGAALRHKELLHAFEPETGLAIPGHPLSVALILLSMIVAALFLLVSLRLKDISLPGKKPWTLFRCSSPVYAVMGSIAGLLLLGYGVQELAGSVSDQSHLISRLLLGCMAAWSAVSILLLVQKNYRSSTTAGSGTLTLVPVFFSCLWLILAYRDRAADPVILDYAYELFAIIFLVLAFYFMAGFFFGKPKVRRMAFASFTGAYFCIVTLADAHDLGKTAAFAGGAIYLLSSAAVMLREAGRPALPSEDENDEGPAGEE